VSFHSRAQNFEINLIERRLGAAAMLRFETFSVARTPDHLFDKCDADVKEGGDFSDSALTFFVGSHDSQS